MLEPSPQRVARSAGPRPLELEPILLPSRLPPRRWHRWLAIGPFLVAALAGSTGLRLEAPEAAAASDRAPATDGRGTVTARDAEPPRSAPPPPAPRRLTLAFTGDILVHESLWELAAEHADGAERFDFRPMFAPLRPVVVAADLAICHLETPLSADDAELSSYPVFETPHELAPAIAWAGYDGCSTASNHSLDGGTEGVGATLRWLDRAGLAHAGTARTPREARRITVYEARGATIAHLSYSWGFNGFTPDEPWRANRIDVPALLHDARRAKRAGADLVAVSLHWGVEYTHAPTSWQEDTAERLARSPAIDLIVGHHAHVVQPIERIHGTWVAYGLGNLLSGMTSSLGTEAVRDGVVLLARAERTGDRWEIGRLSVVTTRVDAETWRVLPILRTLGGRDLPARTRAELLAADARTLGVLGSLGMEVDGVRGGKLRRTRPVT